MEEKDKQQRIFGVQRFKGGESPESILAGSCYLKKPVRFNSLNVIDTATRP